MAKGSERGRFAVYVTAKALSTGVVKVSGMLDAGSSTFIVDLEEEGLVPLVPRGHWHRVADGTAPALERVRALVKARREAMTREFDKLAEIEAGLARGVLPMRKEARRGK